MDTNELYASVQATMSEINELLAKSMPAPMMKDDQAPAPEGIEDEAAASPDMSAPAGPEAPAPEAGAPESPEAEGAEGQHDEMAELSAHAQSLSDEELDQMIQLLMQEKDSRGAAAPEAAAPDMAPPAAPAPDMEAQKSMNAMHKSMSIVINSLEKLTKEVEAIKTAKPAAKPVAQKAVVTNTQQVMQKSGSVAAKPVERLNKSETESFLMGRMRAGDRNITTRDITNLNYVQSDAELKSYQDALTKQGVVFPKI